MKYPILYGLKCIFSLDQVREHTAERGESYRSHAHSLCLVKALQGSYHSQNFQW